MTVNGQVDDTQSAPGSWLPIGEAARRLSVSERTIFRRAERGHLLRRLSQHGQVEVWVPAPLTDKTSDTMSADDGQERALHSWLSG